MEKHIRAAVDRELAAKGLKPADGKPDVWASYILGAQGKRDVDVYPSGWRGWGTRRVVHKYTQGTLVLDLRDGAKNDLVWRATCVDTASDPAKIEKRIDNDVKKALDKFPPKKK